MQEFWSRAAQTKSICRRISYRHFSTAITRRTATAASKRQLKISDIFTACYSTILATAAVADAKVKENRRKEWDRVIFEAKAGTAEPAEEASQRLEENTKAMSASYLRSDPAISISNRQTQARARNSICTTSEAHNCRTNEPFLSLLDGFREPGQYSDGFRDGSYCQKSSELLSPLEDSTSHRLLPVREPATDLHLYMIQRHTGRLISQLLLAIGEDLRFWRKLGFVSDYQWSERIDLRKVLRKVGYATTLPAYSWPNDFAVAEERRELHRCIIKLRQDAVNSLDISLFVTKVCYNLLVTTSPPSIDTYNLLIEAFTQFGRHDLSDVVINGFFAYSRLRPNSASIRLILNHYRRAEDLDGFRMVIKRMRAMDGDMRIRKRVVDELYRPTIQQWALTRNVVINGDLIRQKAPRTALVFQALIRGSLELKCCASSIRFVKAALNEHCQVEGSLVWDLMKACVDRTDTAAARSLLSVILMQWERGTIFPAVKFSSGFRYTMYRLLNLCGVEPSATQEHFSRPLRSLIRHLRLESIAESLERFSQTIHAVMKAVGLSHFGSPATLQFSVNGTRKYEYPNAIITKPPGPPLDWITQACFILHCACKGEKHRSIKHRRALKKSRGVALELLASRIEAMSSKIQGFRKDLLRILRCKLSPKGRALYIHCVRTQDRLSVISRIDCMLLVLRDEANRLETPEVGSFSQRGINNVVITNRNISCQKTLTMPQGRIASMGLQAKADSIEYLTKVEQLEHTVQAQRLPQAKNTVNTGQADKLSRKIYDAPSVRPRIHYRYFTEADKRCFEVELERSMV